MEGSRGEGSRCEGSRINVHFLSAKCWLCHWFFYKSLERGVSQFLRPFAFARDDVCSRSVFGLWKGLGGKGLRGEGCSKAKKNMIYSRV